MINKKFTDEEIVKALMCHFNEELDEEPFQCVDCPLYNDTSPSCTETLKSYALDLINRQKSEIERYKRYYYQHEYDKWEKQIKTKAIKEFAERLKGEIKREKESGDELLSEIYDRDVQMNAEGEKMAFDSVEQIVDNLFKEMVGEEK